LSGSTFPSASGTTDPPAIADVDLERETPAAAADVFFIAEAVIGEALEALLVDAVAETGLPLSVVAGLALAFVAAFARGLAAGLGFAADYIKQYIYIRD